MYNGSDAEYLRVELSKIQYLCPLINGKACMEFGKTTQTFANLCTQRILSSQNVHLQLPPSSFPFRDVESVPSIEYSPI